MNTRISTSICLLALVTGLLWAVGSPAPVSAQTQALTASGGTTFAVASNYSVGWEFTVNQAISLTDVGVFDADGGGLAQNHTVRLYDKTHDSVLATATIPQATSGTLAGSYNVHYVTLPSPISLSTGVNYMIAKQNGLDNYLYDAAATTAPQVNWVSGWGVAGALPATASSFNIQRPTPSCYFGADFKFSAGTPPPGGTLTLSDPVGRMIYQRNDQNLASVKIQGTFSGTVDRIEARVVPRSGYGGTATDWTVVDASPTGGAFSSTLPVHGGWYDIEVRTVQGGTPVASAAMQRVGVGEVFITAGQSNSANYGSPQQYPADDRVSAYNLNTHTWQVANDPQPYATGSGGSPWPHMGDLLAEKYDVPVGVVALGVGATTVGQWQVGGYYDRIYTAINALHDTGFRAILWHQGESDSLAATPSATYAAQLEAIIHQSRVDAGWDVPWGVAIASYHPSATPDNEALVAAGQQMVIDSYPNVFLGAQTDNFHNMGYLSDSVHFNQAGLDAHGQQWADAVGSVVVPEPGTLVLLAAGLLGLLCYAWRRRRS
jgi:hypothetical protein